MVKRFAMVVGLLVVVFVFGSARSASAAGPPRWVFVNDNPATSCGDGHAFPSISAGLAAVAIGGTVYVCPGTYTEDVVVTKSVTLLGVGATVAPSASDTSPLSGIVGNNAFTVLSDFVTIRGFTVEGATGDGILVIGDHALIDAVTALGNGNDGINVDGSSYSTVQNSTVSDNAGGIELANDPATFPPGAVAALGVHGSSLTASYDTVSGNQVVGNPHACGILLVDHAGVSDALGIHDNLVTGNVVVNNALSGFGAGILLASSVPGGAVWNNTVTDNTVSGNGLSGVTVHAHLSGQNLNGNVITQNVIGTNNVRGGAPYFLEPSDPQTTGIFIGSNSPILITVTGNTISNDVYGIFEAGRPFYLNVLGATSNTFTHVAIPIGRSVTYFG